MTSEWKISSSSLTTVHLLVKPFVAVANWTLCPYTFNMFREFKFTGKGWWWGDTFLKKRGHF